MLVHLPPPHPDPPPPSRGAWRVFNPVGEWHADLGDAHCSARSPVACALAEKLRKRGLNVVRVSYSALAPGVVLAPHHGPSNAVVKLHLGLVIPAGCATLTVAGETREWARGGVLGFDDSFLHSVQNSCDEERVVFQVVFDARALLM